MFIDSRGVPVEFIVLWTRQ